MTHDRWSWTTPWIDASLTGLGLIAVLGNGVDRIRLAALGRELAASGFSARARRLLRDPAAWTAKTMILGLVVAVVFVMTVKPGTVGCVGAIGTSLIAGALSAVPLWRAPAPQTELEPST
ncbi:MAG TPA: hypothetical protein VMG41_10650 [Gemmatimonadales bacterium]|nr:hypothetical protein [Gemmatimonadales bacterium]